MVFAVEVADSGLSPIRDLELPIDRGEVELNSMNRQIEAHGDVGVLKTPSSEGKHFSLPRGKRRHLAGRSGFAEIAHVSNARKTQANPQRPHGTAFASCS